MIGSTTFLFTHIRLVTVHFEDYVGRSSKLFLFFPIGDQF